MPRWQSGELVRGVPDKGGSPADAVDPMALLPVRDLEAQLRDAGVPRGQGVLHGGVRQEQPCEVLRGEDGDAIIHEILAGMTHPARVRVERRRGLAIRIALTLAGIGDNVLIAGKGHETTQDMGELKVRYSDRGQVMQALREWTEGRR